MQEEGHDQVIKLAKRFSLAKDDEMASLHSTWAMRASSHCGGDGSDEDWHGRLGASRFTTLLSA